MTMLERYSTQFIDENDIDSVQSTLLSNWLTQGPAVDLFEKQIASSIGPKVSCVAVNSATSALHLAYKAIGLGKGDILVTSPITFAATGNAAIYCGAKIILSDVDKITGCMCPLALKRTLRTLDSKGIKPKLVSVVHLGGTTHKLEEIFDVCDFFGVPVIEDASHALGASYWDEKKVGNSDRSMGAIFSFHPVKMITTGEGGAFVSKNLDLIEKVKLGRTHSIVRKSSNTQRPWEYDILDVGYNYRMSDINAALGVTQITKLDKFVQKRREIAKKYIESQLAEFCQFSQDVYIEQSSFHLFQILLNDDLERTALYKHLVSMKIGANVHYKPLNKLTYLKSSNHLIPSNIPAASIYYDRTLSIPNHCRLDEDDPSKIIKVICDFLCHYRK